MIITGIVNYLVIVFILSGIVNIRYDAVSYKIMKMNKEQKFSRVLGWVNIVLGVLILVGNWTYEHFFM
jgi:hypothetical protein